MSIKISCAGSEALGSLHVAQTCRSLHHRIEISCAGLNGDLCNVYVNSECCVESVPATMAHLCSHQCVVSMLKMLPVCCNKIPQ